MKVAAIGVLWHRLRERLAQRPMAGAACHVAASKGKYFATTLAQRAVAEALHGVTMSVLRDER